MRKLYLTTGIIALLAVAACGNDVAPCEPNDVRRDCYQSEQSTFQRSTVAKAPAEQPEPEPEVPSLPEPVDPPSDKPRTNASMNSGEQRGPNHGDNNRGNGRNRP